MPESDKTWELRRGYEPTDYLTKSEDRNNYVQYCTAVKTLYHAVNGVAPDLATEVRNRKYVDDMRRGKKFGVYTGWRIWDSALEPEISRSDSTAFVFEYTKIDLKQEPVYTGTDSRVNRAGEQAEDELDTRTSEIEWSNPGAKCEIVQTNGYVSRIC